MRPKHLLILTAFAFNVSALYAQQSNSCEGMHSDYSIEKTYQRDIDNIKVASTVFGLYFDVEKTKVEAFTTWAKSQGYMVTQRPPAIYKPEDEISKADLTSVTILQNLTHPTLDYFTSQYKNILNKKAELGITDCGGIGMQQNYLHENELCNGIYEDSIFTNYYNQKLKNKISTADTIKFRFLVKKKETQKIKDWASANQFNTYPDIELFGGEVGEEEFVMMVFNKQLQEPLFDFYAGTIKQVAKMKDELGVGCGQYYVSY